MLKNKKMVIIILLVIVCLVSIAIFCGNREKLKRDTNTGTESESENSDEEEIPEGDGLVEKETEDGTSENTTDVSGSWEGTEIKHEKPGNGNNTQGNAQEKQENKGELENGSTINDDKKWGDLY